MRIVTLKNKDKNISPFSFFFALYDSPYDMQLVFIVKLTIMRVLTRYIIFTIGVHFVLHEVLHFVAVAFSFYTFCVTLINTFCINM